MGVYTCTASNLAGAITTNITLNVLESPRFVKPMQDRKVRTDQTYFPCGVPGTGTDILTACIRRGRARLHLARH